MLLNGLLQAEGAVRGRRRGHRPFAGSPDAPPALLTNHAGAALALGRWPEAGRLVLFPSHLWHGALPFAGEGERLTLAFDIVPKPAPSRR